MNQQFYDIVDTVVAEEEYELTTEEIKLEMTEQIEELFETGEYSLKELKKHVLNNLMTDDEYLLDKYDISEEELKDFKEVAHDLGWDLIKDVLERIDDIQLYKYDSEDDFVEFLLMEFQVLGEIPDKVYPYIDLKHVWNSLIRFSFTETKAGFVCTDI